MRNLRSVVALAVLSAAGAGAEVITDVTPAVVAEAIQYGMKEKRVNFYPALGGALDIGRSMGACYSTPYRRIAVAANEAKRKYKPFTEADVTEAMKAPELHVYVPAWAGQRMEIVSPDAVVILVNGKKDEVIQPSSTLELSAELVTSLGPPARESH